MRPFLALILLLAGCGPGALSRNDYLKQANAIALDFVEYQTQVASAPLPNVRGMPKSQAHKVIADSVRVQAEQDDQFGKRMADLVPPPDLADHKAAFMNLLTGLGPKLRSWADAIQAGDRQKEDATGNEIDSFLLNAMDPVIATVERHGEDASRLKRTRDELLAQHARSG